MKSLVITADASTGITLPVSYQSLVQGYFYSAWKDAMPFLHDFGFTLEKQGLRLFTFSPMEGPYHYYAGEIIFHSFIMLELRSPVDEIVDVVEQKLRKDGIFQLGSYSLPVNKLNISSFFKMTVPTRIQMRSPVCVYETMPNKKTHYFAPGDPQWQLRLCNNLYKKMAALGLPEPTEFVITPVKETLRKRVARFKGTYITGYEGLFDIQTSEEALNILYYSGLGSRNSQGFGMFDCIQKHLPV